MRLLQVDTLNLETFYEPKVPPYVTLSHTWGKDEVSLQDLEAGRNDGRNWTKIYRSSALARKLEYKYIWIDTCCIDKTSSAELSEAINSMYQWYRRCGVCITYLEDVSPNLDEDEDEYHSTYTASQLLSYKTFPKARWFKRGWTLQELIAPPNLHFYDSQWNKIGDKQDLLGDIQCITGIDADVLCDQRWLLRKSIARRMSWASKRETTRIEDIAYCLMGIFEINMPLLYGEGQRAFTCLQEEIMKRTYDHNLFAWNNWIHTPEEAAMVIRSGVRWPDGVGVLANHPMAFNGSADVIPCRWNSRSAPYATTNRGIQICLHVLPKTTPDGAHSFLGLLECHRGSNAIAIPLAQEFMSADGEPFDEYYRTANEGLIHLTDLESVEGQPQLVYLHDTGPYWRDGAEYKIRNVLCGTSAMLGPE
jgi:hypothetical protein